MSSPNPTPDSIEEREYDHETLVRRLKNGVTRHGSIRKVTNYRDHGDTVYLDVVFKSDSIPSGFNDEMNAEIVTAWVETEQTRYDKLLRFGRKQTYQAATFAIPLEMEAHVTH